MQEQEFWCRAFLAAMGGVYTDQADSVRWEHHAAPAAYCESAADAALEVAQRRGMVTGERAASAPPELERVEFTAEHAYAGRWTLKTKMYPDGLALVEFDNNVELDDGNVLHIKWGETMPPQPIEVWLERPKGGA